MTPKEKAIEIYESIYYKMPKVLKDVYIDTSTRTISMLFVNNILDLYFLHDTETRDFYKEVKQEIKKL
jgi:hypothetical protein